MIEAGARALCMHADCELRPRRPATSAFCLGPFRRVHPSTFIEQNQKHATRHPGLGTGADNSVCSLSRTGLHALLAA